MNKLVLIIHRENMLMKIKFTEQKSEKSEYLKKQAIPQA